MKFIEKLFGGNPHKRVLDSLQPVVEKINALESVYAGLTDEALFQKTIEFRARLGIDRQALLLEHVRPSTEPKRDLVLDQALEEILPEAFAVVREAAKRTLGQRPYDVQLMGGMVLHRGFIAEMKTGEGKTLTSTLPIYLNALAGRGVHVVTVNDYLAKRDTVWMGQIFHFLGLSVGCIQNQLVSFVYDPTYTPGTEEGSEEDVDRDTVGAFKVHDEYLRPVKRFEAYQCDITYGTNNEFGFDYLRDNMAPSLNQMNQRSYFYAIIDEIDSILIDEARTPLIISAPAEEATDRYYRFAELVKRLHEHEDYSVDEKMRSATLTESGISKMEEWLGVENIYAEGGIGTVHHIEQALKAHALFKKDREYVVENGEIIIVDEFTGRKMPGRRYSEGLHQAIEAQEGVPIQQESVTLATITFQNFFRMYPKLSGMTGTAETEAEEFEKIYNLGVVSIPTNKPLIRSDLSDRVYKNERGKFQAIVQEIGRLQKEGMPVLVGTISIEKNEILSQLLNTVGIPHEVLNAKNHEREGQIIAQAGRAGVVTIATNMAGRGVDIILGGNPPDALLQESVVQKGGLRVIGTERHESRRIDNQLRGRSGRQGDPGFTQFYVSMEDSLMRIFGSERMQRMMEFLKVPDDVPIENKTISKQIEAAQKKVEGHHFDVRKHLLEYDDVLNRHREVIYEKRFTVLRAYEQSKMAVERRDESTTIQHLILSMIQEEIARVVSFHTNPDVGGDWNFEAIFQTLLTIFPMSNEEKENFFSFQHSSQGGAADVQVRTDIIAFLSNLAEMRYQDLEAQLGKKEMMIEIEKGILLQAIDRSWVEHLVAIDHLRTGIGLRGYGQRDPLVEYKRESFRLFQELLHSIEQQVVYSMYKVGAAVPIAQNIFERKGIEMQGASKTSASSDSASPVVTKPKNEEGKKIGRNEPCHCGSGKKFKKCHGI